uniref:Lens epithelial protein n=1 Tax=Ficedula albicollis TaxID=59894 RepID=A0A803V2M3_FICAL
HFLPAPPLLAISCFSLREVASENATLHEMLSTEMLRLLRECIYLLLCSWCIRELLD